MGVISSSSETAFSQSAEELYDFVTDPRNWPRIFPGAEEVEGIDQLPLQVGKEWIEVGHLGEFRPNFTWRLVSAVRPNTWVFQSVGPIARLSDGTGGFKGTMTISYNFASKVAGVTMFGRSMVTDVPRFEVIPKPIVLMHDPAINDKFHKAVATALA